MAYEDFLLSLRKYGRDSERFKIFCELCGLDDLLLDDEAAATLQQTDGNRGAIPSIGQLATKEGSRQTLINQIDYRLGIFSLITCFQECLGVSFERCTLLAVRA